MSRRDELIVSMLKDIEKFTPEARLRLQKSFMEYNNVPWSDDQDSES